METEISRLRRDLDGSDQLKQVKAARRVGGLGIEANTISPTLCRLMQSILDKDAVELTRLDLSVIQGAAISIAEIAKENLIRDPRGIDFDTRQMRGVLRRVASDFREPVASLGLYAIGLLGQYGIDDLNAVEMQIGSVEPDSHLALRWLQTVYRIDKARLERELYSRFVKHHEIEILRKWLTD